MFFSMTMRQIDIVEQGSINKQTPSPTVEYYYDLLAGVCANFFSAHLFYELWWQCGNFFARRLRGVGDGGMRGGGVRIPMPPPPHFIRLVWNKTPAQAGMRSMAKLAEICMNESTYCRNIKPHRLLKGTVSQDLCYHFFFHESNQSVLLIHML